MEVESDDATLRALFDKVDRNGNGRLDRTEVARLCRQLELRLSEKKLDRAMQEMDKKVSQAPVHTQRKYIWAMRMPLHD